MGLEIGFQKDMLTKYKYYLFCLIVFIGLCSCARMIREPDCIAFSDNNIEATVVTIDKALECNYKGISDAPCFVSGPPNPFSTRIGFAFRLPFSARARIDLCTDKGSVVSTMIDKILKAGTYELNVSKVHVKSGPYVIKLMVKGELVGIRKFMFVK